MRSNADLRNDAKSILRGKWGTAVVITLVTVIIQGMLTASQDELPLLYLLLYTFLSLPLNFGITMTYLYLSRGGGFSVENMFSAFNSTYYIKSVVLGLLTTIYIFLWSMLLFVPGIIKAMSYFLAPYILADNPSLSGEQAICQSMKMMEGHKMDLFLMTLGCVGFVLLSACLLLIPLLWVVPYYQTTFARFYDSVKAEYTPIQ